MLYYSSILILSSLAILSNCIIIDRCVKDKDVALTFEDGPSIKTTAELLDLLDNLRVKATFHIVTRHFDYPQVQQLTSELINRGHVLGYRLEAEWTMQNVTTDGIQGAVDYRLEMIKKASGKKPKFVRTSYNATDLVKNALLASGLIISVPNFETYDYKSDFNTESMLARFDDTSLKSVISVQREFANDLFDTTKAFVEHLRSKGYNIVTLQECTGIDKIYEDDSNNVPKVTYYSNLNIQTQPYSASQSSSSSEKSRNLGKTLPLIVISVLATLILFNV